MSYVDWQMYREFADSMSGKRKRGNGRDPVEPEKPVATNDFAALDAALTKAGLLEA